MVEIIYEIIKSAFISQHRLISVSILFVLGANFIRVFTPKYKTTLFMLLNFSCLYYWFYDVFKYYPIALLIHILLFILFYFIILNINLNSKISDFTHLLPVLYLFAIKYLPQLSSVEINTAGFLGISYLSLKASLFALDLKISPRKVSLTNYLSYIFFFPTTSVGPIGSFQTYQTRPELTFTDYQDLIVRFWIGVAKYYALANFFFRLTFDNYWFDGYRHDLLDLFVCSVAYYLYLYLNFSGFCDIMISISKLAGFDIQENFNNPLLSRNIKDFWNRWHITLSTYMRDIAFTPMAKFFVSHGGVKHINEFTALTILIVFSIVGIWHGSGWNYLLFGVSHAIGLILVHYFTFYLKKISPKFYKRYNSSTLYRWIAWLITFIYISLTFFIFQNNFKKMNQIFELLEY